VTFMRSRLNRLVGCGLRPTDDAELRLKKVSLTLVALIIGPLALLWGVLYALLGHPYSGAIPLSYAAMSLLGLAHLSKTKNVRFMQNSQLVLVLLLPFLLMWSLGGLAASSMVMIWAIFAPIASAMFLQKREAFLWFLGFLALTLVSVLIDRQVASLFSPLPELAQRVFYLLNMGGGSAGLYLLMSYSLNEEKRSVEASLRIAATAFESIEGMMVTDANEVILQVNRAFTTITGYTAADVVGKTPSVFDSGHHDAEFFASIRAQIEGSGSWQGEMWNRRQNGGQGCIGCHHALCAHVHGCDLAQESGRGHQKPGLLRPLDRLAQSAFADRPAQAGCQAQRTRRPACCAVVPGPGQLQDAQRHLGA
jgi:PAS domain S-box-containing protein